MKKSRFSMKKGVSPLIAYVFLVALAVSIGMIVTSTLIERVQDLELGEHTEYCKDISLTLDKGCTDVGVLKLDITNEGSFSIYQLTLGKETNVSIYQWCSYPEANSFLPLVPGDSTQVPLSINATFLSGVNDTLPSCHGVSNGNAGVAEITIVPWIIPEPDGEIIACTDQKIVWSKDLNAAC